MRADEWVREAVSDGARLVTGGDRDGGRYAREAECGNVMINWTPLWRADFQPYGGFKQSGIGKEAPRCAIDEMTGMGSRPSSCTDWIDVDQVERFSAAGTTLRILS